MIVYDFELNLKIKNFSLLDPMENLQYLNQSGS